MRILLVALLWAAPLAHAWTLNDVSILLPLPNPGEQELLLGPNAQGPEGLGKGPLLPYEIFEKLPRLVVGFDRREIFGLLKIVALRIDPCFRERNGPTACRRQIRMVWQPVLAGGRHTLTADAAVHTFYDLSDDEWTGFLRELSPLAGDQYEESLDVHPRIRAQGLGGEHWTRLKAILLRYSGYENLKRATTMSVDTIGSVWAFAGAEIDNGVLKRIMIPRGHHVVQSVFADISQLRDLNLNIRPAPEAPAPWLELVSRSRDAAERLGESGLRDALREAVRLENPALEDTGSVDCVSCHIAQTARLWGERSFPKWNWRAETEAYRSDGLEDLRNNTVQPGFVNRLRAFGYFNDEPAISQRLIHESVEVLRHVRASVSSDCQDLFKGRGK